MYNSQEIPGSDMDRMFKEDKPESQLEPKVDSKAESGTGSGAENEIPQIDPKRLEAMVAKFEKNRTITQEENDKKDAEDIAKLREQLGNSGKAVETNLKDLGIEDYVKNAQIKE